MNWLKSFLMLFGGSGREKKIEKKKEYKVYGRPPSMPNRKHIQVWMIVSGGEKKYKIGTAAEYAPGYGCFPGHVPLGSDPPGLDMSTFPEKDKSSIGKIANYDGGVEHWYEDHGYTADNGYIWNSQHELKNIGIEEAMKLYDSQPRKKYG